MSLRRIATPNFPLMRLRLRLIWMLLSTLWRRRLEWPEESVLRLRVLPNDVDVKAVTNDRYLAYMDLGRIDLTARVGLLRVMVRRRWWPVATFTTIRYRQPLKLFRAYDLRTRVLYWDERTWYFEQRFEQGGRVLATGYVSALILSRAGVVTPDDLLRAAGMQVERPPKPDIVARLQEGEAGVRELQRTDAFSAVHA